MMRKPFLLLPLFALSLVPACGTSDESSFLVVVDTDLPTPEVASRLRVDAYTEAGVWFDTTRPFVDNTLLTLRSRVGYAHDEYSSPRLASSFVSLPGSDFTVIGIALPRDLLLASAGAELRFRNGISVGAQFDGEFSDRSTRYGGTGRVRYSW